MARIGEFTEMLGGDGNVHGEVECGYKTFVVDGQTYLQLDTYGSEERKIQGKVSQSIQLDVTSAAYLMGVLRRTFPQIQ